MELDWYNDKLSADAVLTPTTSNRWSSPTAGDHERHSSSMWSSLLNLVQDGGLLLRGYYSGDEHSPSASNTSSPKKMSSRGAGSAGRCPTDSPLPSSSLSPLSPSKSHMCFSCVLHSHDE